MQVDDQPLDSKLQEIIDLQTNLKLQQDIYASLLKEDKPPDALKEIRQKLKCLKAELKAREDHLFTLSKHFKR
jgi:hypothetical protein